MISVVIPTYNRAGYLPELLDALDAQQLTKSKYEVIFVDNGSTDATAAILQDRCSRQKHLHYGYEGRLGVSNARNRGSLMAQGTYVGLLDDDCLPPENWLETAAQIIADNPGVDMFGGPCVAASYAWRPNWWKPEYDAQFTYRLADKPGKLPDGIHLLGGNMFIKRSLISAVGGFNPDFGPVGDRLTRGGETKLQVDIIQKGLSSRPMYYPDMVVLHRIRAEKLSLWWNVRWKFSSGYGLYRTHHKRERPGLLNIGRRFIRILLGFSKRLVLLPLRDRSQYPMFQNYIFENLLNDIRSLGYWWSQVKHQAERGSGRTLDRS